MCVRLRMWLDMTIYLSIWKRQITVLEFLGILAPVEHTTALYYPLPIRCVFIVYIYIYIYIYIYVSFLARVCVLKWLEWECGNIHATSKWFLFNIKNLFSNLKIWNWYSLNIEKSENSWICLFDVCGGVIERRACEFIKISWMWWWRVCYPWYWW